MNCQALRQPNETPKAYRIRLYKNKSLYGLSNEEIGKLCNEAFGVEWTESAHRKKTQNYLKGYNDAKEELGSVDQQLQNMIEENRRIKRDAEKELKKIQTEKLEYNKWLREEARDEMITNKICSTISTLPHLQIPDPTKQVHKDKTYLLVFGDCHYGIEFKINGLFGEVINEYSPEIFELRMQKLLDLVVEQIKKENIQKLSVWEMGDGLQGILRLNSQLMKLRYGIIDSSILYANYLSEWLNKLSHYVKIDFQMVIDSNHNQIRLLNAPKNSFSEENMSKTMLTFIKERLKDNPNIEIIENPTGMNYISLSGYYILGNHGEWKNSDNTINEFTRAYSAPIDYLIGAHCHHGTKKENGIDAETLTVGSVIGVDPYGMSLNKTARPSASMFTFEKLCGKVREDVFKLD